MHRVSHKQRVHCKVFLKRKPSLCNENIDNFPNWKKELQNQTQHTFLQKHTNICAKVLMYLAHLWNTLMAKVRLSGDGTCVRQVGSQHGLGNQSIQVWNRFGVLTASVNIYSWTSSPPSHINLCMHKNYSHLHFVKNSILVVKTGLSGLCFVSLVLLLDIMVWCWKSRQEGVFVYLLWKKLYKERQKHVSHVVKIIP